MITHGIPEMPPHERAHAVAAAALLHDVGKILHAGRVELPEGFRQKWESIVCPLHPSGAYRTHQHALYTAYALDQTNLQTAGLDVGRLFQLAAYHHNPSGNDFDQNLITKADWIASGHDREEDSDREEQTVTGLQPPLVALHWPAEFATQTREPMTIPTLPLDFHPDAFLPRKLPTEAEYRAACRSMTSQLLDDMHRLESRDASDCIDKIMGLLERYLHSIPASRGRRHEPDVNLFDHSRLVAAFASCLAVQHESGPCDAIRIKGCYRLASLALGGIQAFITRSVPAVDGELGQSGEKGMAKRLRARSFYVRMLSWLLGRRILSACGLPAVNLIQDAGGKLMLLLPDTPAVIQQFNTAIDYARRWFHTELGGLLRLDVALSDPLTDDAFKREHFAATLRNCDDRLAAARYANPWPHLLSETTWREHGWVDDSVSLPVDRESFLRPLQKLGELLPKSSVVWIDDAARSNSNPDSARGEIDILGFRISIGDRPSPTSRQFVLTLGATGENLTADRLPLLLTANYIPVRDKFAEENLREVAEDDEASTFHQPLTFSEIAALATDDEGCLIGHSMLGALKADVDHLGMLFGYGFDDRVSIGRFAGAARYLDMFFKGFLDERLPVLYPRIYTVFAGGDDLFLIGPWYDMARFSDQLQGWFQQAVCANPCVHLSAGLVFAKPTTPVSRLAGHAEDVLHRAKNEGRNKIAVGPITLAWPEYHEALSLHQAILESVREPGGATSSLVYRLLQYAKQAVEARAGSPTDLKWRSQMSYDLGRNLPKPQAAGPYTNSLREELQKILHHTDARRLHVAASFTLYRLRGKAV